jgi:hypothetical protein
MQIGRVEAHVLSDGTLRMDGGMCFGIIPKVLWEKVAPPDELNRILWASTPSSCGRKARTS